MPMEIAVRVGDRFPVERLGTPAEDRLPGAGRIAVVYFYPKDFTGTCTRQAVEFNRRLDEFRASGVEVIGVSVDDGATHERFCAAKELRFPLVADPGGGLSSQLGILKDYGAEDGELSRRVTFLLDRSGVIRAIWPVTDVIGNVDEALAAARELVTADSAGGAG